MIFLIGFSQQVYCQELFPYLTKDNKWGYVDSEMKMIISPIYESAHPFAEGLAAVMKDDLFGFLNAQGDLVIECKYYDFIEPSEGLIAVQDARTQKWGFIDYTGKTVFAFNLDWAGPFVHGLAAVTVNGYSNYTDKLGHPLNEEHYDFVTDFNEDGYAHVDEGLGKQRVIDTLGNFHDDLSKLPSEGFYIKKENDRWSMNFGRYGFVRVSDRVEVILPLYEMVSDFSEGLAPVLKYDRWAYIDTSNNVVIGFKFNDAWTFSDGLAAVQVGDKKGYINKKGEWIIQPLYDMAGPFRNGIAEVRVGDVYFYITKQGRELRE